MVKNLNFIYWDQMEKQHFIYTPVHMGMDMCSAYNC